MNQAVLSTVWDLGGPASELLADSFGVLILLAAGFLVFRTFRERYLLAWILGWSFYLLYRVSTASFSLITPPAWLIAVSQGAYACAIALFVAAILYYTRTLKYGMPLAVAGVAASSLAVARALWWPGSSLLLAVVRGVCALMAVGGGVQLGIFSRGRRQVGPWVLIAMLLLLHMDQDTASPHFLAGIDMVIELLLGLSMLVMVLDDSKQRTDRLGAVNAISGAMAGAQEHGSMVLTALEQLKKSTGARAAWFRILDGNKLVLTRHVGLSEKFIRERSALDVRTADGARVAQQGVPAIMRAASLEEDNRRLVREEGFDHILLVPIRGKTAVIGAIVLGQARNRSYPPDELEFLTAIGHQVGIAVENLRLMEEIIRSHRQWISTFDSIEDMVLVHDSDFRILKLNRAVVKRLGSTIADVVFHQCDQVLPGAGVKWQQCPIANTRAPTSAKALTRVSEGTRSCPRPPSPREARIAGRFTLSGTPPNAVRRRNVTGCCSSRCRRGCLFPRRKAASSSATMHSPRCLATSVAKSCCSSTSRAICMHRWSSASHSAP